MKKTLVLMLALVMVFSVCALTACGGKEVTYTGEYKYVNAYGDGSTFYGAKVTVTVKGDKITAVEVAADTETMFNLSANWTVDYTITGEPTEGKKAWMDNGASFAQSFVGKTVEEVNAITVTCKETGEPSAITGVEYVTGATQSSGRLILAIQNAVKFHGEKTVTGEYKYVNAYGDGSTFYGASVSLTVENGVITAATLAADTETMFNLSANWTVDYTITGEPTEGKKAWMDKGEDFVQSFVGKTVEEVMAITVTCKETGEPSAITGVEYVTGATQSSGRVILAVQNALSK